MLAGGGMPAGHIIDGPHHRQPMMMPYGGGGGADYYTSAGGPPPDHGGGGYFITHEQMCAMHAGDYGELWAKRVFSV